MFFFSVGVGYQQRVNRDTWTFLVCSRKTKIIFKLPGQSELNSCNFYYVFFFFKALSLFLQYNWNLESRYRILDLRAGWKGS